MFDLSYSTALEKAEHLKALGYTTVHLRDDAGFPYEKVSSVEAGHSYRLGGPAACYFRVEEAGLVLLLSLDFEARESNGSATAQFDRDRLREVAAKLSPEGRAAFADLLADHVLPALAERTDEIRSALRDQADSADCVRGLIAFAREA